MQDTQGWLYWGGLFNTISPLLFFLSLSNPQTNEVDEKIKKASWKLFLNSTSIYISKKKAIFSICEFYENTMF